MFWIRWFICGQAPNHSSWFAYEPGQKGSTQSRTKMVYFFYVFFYLRTVYIFFVLLLSSANLGASYYLTYYDIPIMSTGAFKPDFGDKTTFSTMMRMAENYQHIGTAFTEVSSIETRHTGGFFSSVFLPNKPCIKMIFS